jgi:WD40 repeat protein
MEPNSQEKMSRSVITAMAYSPDSCYIALGGMNVYNEGDDMDNFQQTQLHIVEARSGEVIRTLYQDADEPHVFPYFFNIVWTHDGSELLVSTGELGEVWRFDATTGQQSATYKRTRGAAQYTDLSPDERLIAVTGGNGRFEIFDANSGSMFANIEIPRVDRPTSSDWIKWSPDGAYLAVGSRDGRMRIFESTGFEVVHSLEVYTGRNQSVKSGAWSPDSRYLAIYGDGDSVLWDMASGTLARELFETHRHARILGWHPTKPVIFDITSMGLLRYNVTNRAAQYAEHAHEDVRAAALSPDGRWVAIGGKSFANPVVQISVESLGEF